ncbi:MAG: long-chain fatty acid--CoA ligase [Hydrogenophilales bacterium 17-61-9]|nr:MAG: long-chain fatty acid--CoA ligase [Hydrogenophilales bacterium 17-61-9]
MINTTCFHLPFSARASASGPAIQPWASNGIEITDDSTLDGVFRIRVRRTPHAAAYLQHDPASQSWREFSWQDTAREVARWQAALATLNLRPGERVALMLGNCREWIIFDQAAIGLGLVTVPLYTSDRADNIDWVLNDAGCRALLIGGQEHWDALQPIRPTLDKLDAVISLTQLTTGADNLKVIDTWLPEDGAAPDKGITHAGDLATLVYTSGTTGRPKGVMLSHRNILFDVKAGLQSVAVHSSDRMLSFLPLSHMLERSIGYYLPVIAGCSVAFARSIPQLAEDLTTVKPTILISVPRIFERVHGRIHEALASAPPLRQKLFARAVDLGWQAFLHRQGRAPWSPGLMIQPALDHLVGAKIRAKLGGKMRFAISGGAPLPADISRTFIALGVDILQGYGLTETSPVISVNRPEDNEPTSVGPALPGVEVKLGEHDELLTRSPAVMLGYWKNPETTQAMIDTDGWLHTGDQVRIGPRGHITITGRLKEILVLSTGEKVSPADVEQSLAACPLLEQVMVVGDGRSFLTALVVPRPDALARIARALHLPETGDRVLAQNPEICRHVLEQLQPCLHDLPGYARLAGVALLDEAMSVENGLLTPTLKLKRNAILKRYQDKVDALYAGH